MSSVVGDEPVDWSVESLELLDVSAVLESVVDPVFVPLVPEVFVPFALSSVNPHFLALSKY